MMAAVFIAGAAVGALLYGAFRMFGEAARVHDDLHRDNF